MRVLAELDPSLSRGLRPVKWLLAPPHYLVVGLFVGGGLRLRWWPGDDEPGWAGGGPVGILVAGIVLPFTGGTHGPCSTSCRAWTVG